MIRTSLSLMLIAALLSGCIESVPSDQSARILTMGDSMLAWRSGSGEAISDDLEDLLGEPVVDRSVTSARMTHKLGLTGGLGLSIPDQYKAGNWDWVILNGGGNDLRFGCGCRKCDAVLNTLIGQGGQDGVIPSLVRSIRASGARVIYVGYLPSPGVISVVDVCEPAAAELERRLTRMAAADPGVTFLSLSDLVPYGDRSFHEDDMIHPSPKASRMIAEQIVAIMR